MSAEGDRIMAAQRAHKAQRKGRQFPKAIPVDPFSPAIMAATRERLIARGVLKAKARGK